MSFSLPDDQEIEEMYAEWEGREPPEPQETPPLLRWIEELFS